jgi:hypothetical protein
VQAGQRENRCDRFGETLKPVDHGDQNAFHSSVAQLVDTSTKSC